MRGLLVKNGVVTNIAVFNSELPEGWSPDVVGVGIGWVEDEEGTLSAPPVAPVTLGAAKQSKVRAVNSAAGAEILAGFSSNATGVPRWYRSGRDDQLNLIGLVSVKGDRMMLCSTDGALWDYVLHTKEQRGVVLSDGADVKHDILKKARGLKEKISDATEAQLLEINW